MVSGRGLGVLHFTDNTPVSLLIGFSFLMTLSRLEQCCHLGRIVSVLFFVTIKKKNPESSQLYWKRLTQLMDPVADVCFCWPMHIPCWRAASHGEMVSMLSQVCLFSENN